MTSWELEISVDNTCEWLRWYFELISVTVMKQSRNIVIISTSGCILESWILKTSIFFLFVFTVTFWNCLLALNFKYDAGHIRFSFPLISHHVTDQQNPLCTMHLVHAKGPLVGDQVMIYRLYSHRSYLKIPKVYVFDVYPRYFPQSLITVLE